MIPKILKFCSLLIMASPALASRTIQVSTTILDGKYLEYHIKQMNFNNKEVLEGFGDDLNIHPFTKIGQKLYYFGQKKVTWYKAFLICRSLGGFLASLESAEELQHLSDYITEKYPSKTWWLSGSNLDAEGDYYWYSTGERVGFADWSPGQPDNYRGEEHCTELFYNKSKYQMNDWRCNGTTYFICEADKPKTIVVSVF